jgi:dihydrofolate reductase
MGIVIAAITTSLDGYYAAPGDRPGCGLGVGGERLHYWVFGGPWTYDEEPTGQPTGRDREVLDEWRARLGAVVAGRRTFEAADRWGETNPWGLATFIPTHRVEQDPPTAPGMHFASSFDEALTGAREAAGDRDVMVMGGGDVIRQALAGGHVAELHLTLSPVLLGGGKRLFDGTTGSLDLEQLGVEQSAWATHLHYRAR